MFGKPHWFKPKTFGWGLVPVTWQGWGYAGGWAAAIALPFLLLVERHQPLEATAWLALAIRGLTCDVWEILESIKSSSALGVVRNNPSPSPMPDSPPVARGCWRRA